MRRPCASRHASRSLSTQRLSTELGWFAAHRIPNDRVAWVLVPVPFPLGGAGVVDRQEAVPKTRLPVCRPDLVEDPA